MRVLVVDDSAVVRQLMTGALGSVGMEVQVAADPIFAIQKLKSWSPDVIVLDLEMPRMDGLTFLRVLRSDTRIPVVVCSGVAGERSVLAMRALEEGAVEIVARPRVGLREYFQDSVTMLSDAIKAAAQTRKRRRRSPTTKVMNRGVPIPPPHKRVSRTDTRLVAIGASTGGPETLHRLIAALPEDAPPTVIVQHMPEGFTTAFAARLHEASRVQVKEAEHGEPLAVGKVLIAPGGRHLSVRGAPGRWFAEVTGGPLVSRHRPSVDVLFHSVALSAGRHAVGVMLTGMGDDGTRGMTAMRAVGARTLAQDEASCVVFGMPKAAIDAGCVDEVITIQEMARAILRRD